MIDLGALKGVPGVATAVDAHAAAERMLAVDPTLAEGDPTAFLTIFTLLAWVKSEGRGEVLTTTLERMEARANQKDA